MNSQKLIIYDYIELFNILNELKNELNIEISQIPKDDLSNLLLRNNENNLIITQKKILEIENQVIANDLPIKIFKLVEKFNIEFLKKKFGQQSEIDIGNYKINLNSRELMFNKKKIKLTEKESSIILYLLKYKKPISIEELQSKVWGYQSELETHTVETHIYRLRKKILKIFNDANFIISKKNGYQIS
jgi:DNA-binding response OmpR family regulator